jgi:undecaprenyl-diphosphatase
MAAAWDIAIFRAVHHGLRHPALDPVMKALTDPGPWKIPLFVLFGAVFLSRRRRGVIALVALTLTLTASDQLSSAILKPIFARPRPSVALADTRPLFGVRHTYSFPSSHATNFFAAAPVVSALFPSSLIACYALAAAVSYSRIYVGDHYPSDVIAGAILGSLVGFLGRKGYRRALRTWGPGGEGAAEAMPATSSAGAPNAGP